MKMGLDVSADLIVGIPIEGIKFWGKKEYEEQTCNIRQEESSVATGRAHYTKNLKANFCEVCGSKLMRVVVAKPTKGFVKLCKELEPDSTPEDTWEWWTQDNDEGVGLWTSESNAYGERDLFGIKLANTGSHKKGCILRKGDLDKAFEQVASYCELLKATGTISFYVALNVSS